MKTNTAKNLTRIFVFAVTSLSLVPAMAMDRYQQRVLLEPSQAILAMEERGRVTIYDGVESDVVEMAMTQQYDRIENMMFVRVRHTAPDGTYEVEEDGCD